MSAEDVVRKQQIGNVRIHVERAINKIEQIVFLEIDKHLLDW